MIDYNLLNSVLTFDTLAPAVLPSTYRMAKFEAILDASTAQALGVDIYAMHANIYPYIRQNGVPNDPTQYMYAKFSHNGTLLVLGMPWINQDTVQVIETTSLVITLAGRGTQDIERLKRALQSNAFDNFSIEISGSTATPN